MVPLFTWMLFVISMKQFARSLPVDESKMPEVIAFGSCAGMRDLKGPIFKAIADLSPDLWVWMGDAAYVTVRHEGDWVPADESRVDRKFAAMKSDVSYQRIVKSSQITGTWDDHDYNERDGGRLNPTKAWMQVKYLDFLDEPKDSIRRKRPGIYTSYKFGTGKQSVTLILLDMRYFRQYPNIRGTNEDLGPDQWRWLEELLKTDTSTFKLIASSIQVLPDDRLGQEAMSKRTKTKLFDLISRLKLSGVTFLSGDVHSAQIMKTPCPVEGIGYNFWEFTSSGLTHTCKDHVPFCDHVVEIIIPKTWDASPRWIEKNFGTIRFDWKQSDDPTMIWEIRSEAGEILDNQRIRFSDVSEQTESKHVEAAALECPASSTPLWRVFTHLVSNVTVPWIAAFYIVVLLIGYLGLMCAWFCFSRFQALSNNRRVKQD